MHSSNKLRKTARWARDSARINVIELGMGLLLLAIFLPIAITEFVNTSTLGWDSRVVTVWTLVPLVVLIGVLLVYLPRRSGGRGGL